MDLAQLPSYLQVATKQWNNRDKLRYLPREDELHTREVKPTEVRQVPSEDALPAVTPNMSLYVTLKLNPMYLLTQFHKK